MTQSAFSVDYSAVRDGGAGLIDLSARGRIMVSGSEAVMFLNGLITNDMKTLAANSWMVAAFPNVQGRLLAVVRILNRTDGFLIDTEAATHQKVLQLLDRFTLAGDFRVTDVTNQTATISLQGIKAAEVLSAIFGEEVSNVARYRVASARLNQTDVTIIRATHTGEDGFDLFIEAAEGDGLKQALIDAGAISVSEAVAEVLRIEAGIPRYGVDMDETTIVTETNLDDAVSFTKGCYLGQEVVERIRSRGHVNKKLCGLLLDGDIPASPGDKLSAGAKEVGQIASSVASIALHRPIALGYVNKDCWAPGTKLTVHHDGGDFGATVSAKPIVAAAQPSP
jgi:folate-binding protein YgfZ